MVTRKKEILGWSLLLTIASLSMILSGFLVLLHPEEATADLSPSNITISGASSGTFKVGDSFKVSWDALAAGYASGVDHVEVDYSDLGGPTLLATLKGNKWVTYWWNIPQGSVDRIDGSVVVRAYSSSGLLDQGSTAKTISFDNEVPLVLQSQITLSGAGSDGVYSDGATLSITWYKDNNHDISQTVIDVSAINVMPMYIFATLDPTNTHYVGEYTIPTGHPDMDNAYVRVIVTDDAGNSGYTKSTPFILHEPINSVPEPSTLFLLVSGLAGLVGLGRIKSVR
jgi:hypothetical protein